MAAAIASGIVNSGLSDLDVISITPCYQFQSSDKIVDRVELKPVHAKTEDS